MAKISYYFALSLDGFIARLDHKVDWLDPYFCDFDTPYEFKTYMQSVSTIIMGRKTFEVSLKMGPLPFAGKPGFVYTNNRNYSTNIDGVKIICENVIEHIQELKKNSEGRIWLLGGGELAAFLLEHNLLDELAINIMPIMIGKGIPWIGDFSKDKQWNLSEHYVIQNGIVQLIYQRK